MSYQSVYERKQMVEWADGVLASVKENKGLSVEGLKSGSFDVFGKIAEINKNEDSSVAKFADFARTYVKEKGERAFKAEEIIGLVTSTIPRILSATSKLGLPIEIACEYENILANAERQRVSSDIAKSLFKNRDYITSMKYTAKEEGYKDSAQKGFYNMDIIDRSKFEEYLDFGLTLSENANVAQFDENIKPTSINVFARNNKETFELMQDNISDMQGEFIFG